MSPVTRVWQQPAAVMSDRVITGLIAQGMRPNTAAAIGTYLHGKAGDLVKEAQERED